MLLGFIIGIILGTIVCCCIHINKQKDKDLLIDSLKKRLDQYREMYWDLKKSTEELQKDSKIILEENNEILEQNNKLIEWIYKILNIFGTIEIKHSHSIQIPIYTNDSKTKYFEDKILEEETILIPEIILRKTRER